MRRLMILAALSLQGACASAGSTLGSGVGDRQLEHPPYFAGRSVAELPIATIARYPIGYQRGASQAELFDPRGEPGTPMAAFLAEMNAFADSLFGGAALAVVGGGDMVAPNVYFGCERDGTDDCVERGDSVLGRRGTTMRLAIERPSAAWVARHAAALDSAGSTHGILITVEVGQYWLRQNGLRGAKSVELGTNHVVSQPWMTSLETPVPVIQLTGALLDRQGKAVRIGAEGVLAQRNPLLASGLGAQRVISEEDVQRARTLRRADLPGQPLAWRVALCTLALELAGKRCTT